MSDNSILQRALKPEYQKYLPSVNIGGITVAPSTIRQGFSQQSPMKISYGTSTKSTSSTPVDNRQSWVPAGSIGIPSYSPRVSYQPGSQVISDGARTLSEEELWNTQLQNAVLMRELGYGVSFQDGEMVYDRMDYLEPYGNYGYQASNLVYEDDYQLQQAQQMSQYQPQYPRYQYQTDAYSSYSQQYPWYNQRNYGYRNNRYQYNNRRRYYDNWDEYGQDGEYYGNGYNR